MKYIYIVFVVLYLLIIVIWCYRYPISYKMTTGIDPKLITRDLTKDEYDGIEKAFYLRRWMSSILLYSSFFMTLSSYGILRTNLIMPKTIMILSAIAAIILVIVNGIHFIP